MHTFDVKGQTLSQFKGSVLTPGISLQTFTCSSSSSLQNRQNFRGLTRGKERDGFEAAVLGCVHLQSVEPVHLVLEHPDLVHEGHHTLGGHGR